MDKVVEPKDELCTRAVTAGAYDATKGIIEVVFATETPVLTRDCDWQPIYEILSCEPGHVRMERFNSGAPVLDNHNRHGSVTTGTLGRVQKGASFANGEGRAELKISQRKDLDGFRQDLADGIIGNVSAGYRVYKYLDISQRDDKIPTLKAVDWEPMEVSFTGVQADYKSQVRSADIINNKPEIQMITETAENVASATPAAAPVATPETLVAAASAAAPVAEGARAAQPAAAPGAASAVVNPALEERNRIRSIGDLVRVASLDDAFQTRMIDEGLGLDRVRAEIFTEMETRQLQTAPAQQGVAATRMTGGNTDGQVIVRGIGESLSQRILGEAPTTEEGKKRVGHNFVDHARTFLTIAGESTDGLSSMEIISRSMSTTDYPLALADVMNKTLKKPFTAAESTWRKFATKIPANDFKNLYNVRVDGSFIPEEMTEDGEYKAAAFTETGDNFALKTYGKKIAFTRKMMINDDLSAFTRTAPAFANGAVRLEASLVYGLLTMASGLGRTLADGVALFNAASHKNYVSSGTVMSLTSYNLAKVAMSRQLGLDGQAIKIRPKYLLVPPELETLALQLINSTINPTNTSQANPFYGVFEVIVDPYLTDATAWYVLADPADIDVFLYATLNGQEGLWSDSRYNWDTDALETKVRHDFAATIQEYRGIYKNVGA